MHYDFRLEQDGVLKSWAVPKGPSPNPADKRLAVHVEDHPIDYASFEGLIPPGNYGAGAVIVWDRGLWVPLNDFDAGFAKGKLLFELRGYKLRGKWTLVKTKRAKSEWLLIKERDAYASAEGTADYPHDSVLSGRTVEQMAAGDPRGATIAARLQKAGARRRDVLAKDLKPMLATPGKPFAGAGWVFELKYDGYRLFAEKRDGVVTLYSRAGHDFTATFPEVVDVVAALPFERFILDGEVVVSDERGLPSFALLQKRGRLTKRADVARAAVELPASLYAFDLLVLRGTGSARSAACSSARPGCARCCRPRGRSATPSTSKSRARRCSSRPSAWGSKASSANAPPRHMSRSAPRIGSRSMRRSPTTSSSSDICRRSTGRRGSALCCSANTATAC